NRIDEEKNNINKRILYKVYGYRSLANEGPLSGCCGEKLQAICLICQYEITIQKSLGYIGF
ncbi:hypothetical protein HZS_7265, partial [Henneguya salminicola]